MLNRTLSCLTQNKNIFYSIPGKTASIFYQKIYKIGAGSLHHRKVLPIFNNFRELVSGPFSKNPDLPWFLYFSWLTHYSWTLLQSSFLLFLKCSTFLYGICWGPTSGYFHPSILSSVFECYPWWLTPWRRPGSSMLAIAYGCLQPSDPILPSMLFYFIYLLCFI